MKQFSTKEVFSIPNLMGYFRILLIPLFCYLYIAKEAYLWASIVVLVSSLTDLFDGLIARKFHMITQLGKALDPIADKLTHAALAICLAIRYPYMWWLIGLMIVKEGYMGIMGLIFLRQGKMLDGAILPLPVVNGLIILMVAVMLFTLLMYIPVFNRMRKETSEKGK